MADYGGYVLNSIAVMAVLAFIVDLLVGDPRWIPHPVVIIGKLISFLDKGFRKLSASDLYLRIAGLLTVMLVVGSAYGVTWGILRLAELVHPWLRWVLSVWFLSTAFAAKGLGQAGTEIADLLTAGDLAEARRKVGWIVGRDTDRMDEGEVCRAAVETVAENTSDGVVAPLLYGIIGGPALAMAYKAVNTLDSMLGYKNPRYLYFGWASAKLDDLANLVPARITGFCLVLASAMMGKGFTTPFRTMLKYAPLHPSPNGGYPEAAVAGSLRIQLGGLNYYGGVPEERARMGEPCEALNASKLRSAVGLMYLASVIALAAFVLARVILELLY